MAINNLNSQQKKEIAQQLIAQGHGAAAAKLFPTKVKKQPKPKQKRSKETSNFILIFGGGFILTLLILYFGIEHGYILLKF